MHLELWVKVQGELGRQRRRALRQLGSNDERRTRGCSLQPGYLLHHRPWRDTSRILEVLTRDHGRVSLFARGARGAEGGLGARGILQPFRPLLLSWSGKGEAGQLTAAELAGAMPRCRPPA